MFKSKIDPEALSSMAYKDYLASLKKEVKKAQKFGRTEVVVLSDFKFSCGTVSTMMILGKIGGPIAKWYKKIKKERKVEKDFAKGDCFFELADSGETKLHIALNDGKGKPNKMSKNGKKLFKRLGFVPNIFKGALPDVGASDGLTSRELETIEEQAQESNEGKGLGAVAKQYQAAFKSVANQIVPLLKMGDKAVWKAEHLDISKKAFLMSKSFQDKYEEAAEKAQEKFAEFKSKVDEKQLFLQKIAAKVKQNLKKSAQVHGSDKNVDGLLDEVGKTIKEMRKKFDEAFSLIEKIKASKK